MSPHGRIASLLVATALLIPAATCSDFDEILPPDSDALFDVDIQPMDWPTSLKLGESSVLEVQIIEQSSGNVIQSAPGMQVTWSTTDPAIRLEGTSGTQNTVWGEATGQGTPTVRVSGGPVKETTYDTHIIDVVAAGVRVTAPGQDTTLTARGDSVWLAAFGLDVNGTETPGTGVTWRRGSGPEVIQLVGTQGDSVRGYASGQGEDTLFASVTACQATSPQVCEAHVVVSVVPVAVAMLPTVDTVRLDALGATGTVDVRFEDRNGFSVAGVAVQWRLETGADSTIIALDTLSGAVTALAPGVTRVVVSSFLGEITVPVKVFQRVAATGLDTTSIVLEGLGREDTLALAPTDANGNALQRTPTVTWSSSDTLTVRVSPVSGDTLRAVIQASGFGDAWVYADAEGVVDSVMVTATGVVASVSLSPSRVTVTQLSERPVVQAAAYDSAANQIPNAPFTWESADETVVTIAALPGDPTRGELTPVANGQAYVRVHSGSFSDSALVVIDAVTIFSCDQGGGTEHPNAFLTASETWTRDASPHYMRGEITFDGGGVVLTIEPGALVCADWGAIVAQNGARLDIRGTEAERILMTVNTGGDRWEGINLYDTPGDTSRIAHTVMQLTWNGLRAWDPHPLAVDSSLISQTYYTGVYLGSRGSRFTNSTVEGVVDETSRGIELDNHQTTFENSTIRGSNGIGLRSYGDTINVVGGLIEGARLYGMYTAWSHFDRAAPVRIRDTYVPTRMAFERFWELYPTQADQDSLLGNRNDYVAFIGSENWITGSYTVRADMRWWIQNTLTFDDPGQLTIEPGGEVFLSSGQSLEFYNNATLQAVGTATDSIIIDGPVTANPFHQIYFDGDGAATDTSRLKFVRIARSNYGLQVWNQAAVHVDSSQVRQSEWQAMASGSRDFRVTATVVDTTNQVGTNAIDLYDRGIVLEDVTLRGSAEDGIAVFTDSVTLRNVTIEGAAGLGLEAGGRTFTELSGLYITGGASYPAELSIGALASINTDSLTGNAKDTLLVNGGSVKGTVDLFGNFTAIDTLRVGSGLPWLVTGTPTVDSAAVLELQPGAVLTFRNGQGIAFRSGRLDSRATSASPAVFMAEDPTQPWGGLDFHDNPKDTSYVRNVVFEYGGNSGWWPYRTVYARDSHPVVIDSATFRQIDGNAVRLSSNGNRIMNTVFDTVDVFSGTGAVDLYGDSAVLENIVIRDPGGIGLYNSGPNATINGLRIEGAAGDGLQASEEEFLAVSNVRITGGDSYPLLATVENLYRIAPTAADQDSLLGNAKDTLRVVGGRLKGELDLFGNPTAVDTLVVRADVPWRIEGNITIDSAAVLMPEPGAHIAFDQYRRIDMYPGRLVAEGTETDPVVFASAHPLQQGVGLYFGQTPSDTSYLRHVRLEYLGGDSYPNVAIYAESVYPIVAEHVFIKRPKNRGVDVRADGTRLVDVYVDSAGGSASGSGAVDLRGRVTVDTLTVFYPEANGVTVMDDSVTLRDVRIEGAGGFGLEIDPGRTLAAASHVVVTNGRSYGLQIPPQNLPILAPTRPDQDSLMGNALDTLRFFGGTVRGEIDAFGNPTKVDTLLARSDFPWLVTGRITMDSASLLLVEAGAYITVNQNVDFNMNHGQMLVQGTATDTVVFRATHPLSQWGGLEFRGTPADTSRVSYTRFEDSGSSGNWPYYTLYTADQHPVVFDNIVVKRSEYRAIYLGAPGSRVANAVVDTAHGTNTGSSGAVYLQAYTTLDSVTVRGAAWRGIWVNDDSVRLRNVRILESAGVGLYLNASADPAEMTNVRVTGGQVVPVVGNVRALWMLDQDSLMGNARDTLVFNGGTLRGQIDAGVITRTDTMYARASLPWRLDADVVFDSASVLYAEPGARIEVDANDRILFYHGQLLSMGTQAEPVRFTNDSPAEIWEGLEFGGVPQDTSRMKHTIVEYSGANSGSEYVAIWTYDQSPLVIDSSVIRQSEFRAVDFRAPGSRIQYSVVDTTHSESSGLGAVELWDGVSMRGTLVRGAFNTGVFIRGDNVVVDSSEVTLSGDTGLLMGSSSYVSDPTTNTVEYCNFVDNTGNGMGNQHSTNFTATNNWWGDATDGGANWDGVGGNITYVPFLSAAITVPYYKPGG